MRRHFRIARRILIGLVAVIVLFIGAAVAIARTDRFREFLRDQVVSLANQSFRGEVSLGRIEGFILSHLSLHDFRLRYEGREVLSVPRLDLRYSIVPLLRGKLEVFGIDLDGPAIRMTQDGEGKWDLLLALQSRAPAPAEPEPGQGGGITVSLDSLALEKGTIEARFAGEPPQTYRLVDVGFSGSVLIAPEGIEADVHRLATQILAPDMPPAWAEARLGYDATGETASASVERFVVSTEQSRISLTGKVPDVNALTVELRLAIERIAGADIARFAPQWPAAEDVTGFVEIAGPRSDLQGKLEVAAGAASLAGDFRANAAEEVPTFAANARLANLDLARFRPDAAGVVEATVRAEGAGGDLARAKGEAAVAATGLRYTGWQVGELKAEAAIADQKARFTANASGAGTARLEGEAELAGAESYRISLVTKDFNPQKIATDGTLMAGDLDLDAKVEGRGFDLATMDTRAELTVSPSRLDRVAIRRGRVDARISEERLRLAEGSVTAENATVNVRGELPLGATGDGKISYSVVVADLAPWLRLAGQEGRGRLSLEGAARGNAAKLAASGKLELAEAAVGTSTVEHAALRYDVKEVVGGTPNGSVDLAAKTLEAGLRLDALDTSVRLFPGLPQRAHVNLRAQEHGGRKHEIRTDVVVRDAAVVATLTRVALELPDGLWSMEAPARITTAGGAIEIDRFRLRNGDRGVSVAGRFAPSGKQDLHAEIEGLPLASVKPFLAQDVDVEGTFAARAAVAGTAEAPEISLDASIAALRIQGQPYQGFTTTVRYGGGMANLDAAFRQDAAHALTAAGRVPMRIAWAQGFQAEPTGDVDLRLKSNGLSIAFLNAFGGRNFRDAVGEIHADVGVTGPLSKPEARGLLALYNASIFLIPLKVGVTEGTLETWIDPRSVSLTKLWLKSGEGKIWGHGMATMVDGQVRGLDVLVQADDWPAIRTSEYDAGLDGWISAGGTLDAPQIYGKIEVTHGVIRPDLEFLTKSPPAPDATITVVRSDAPPPPPTAEPPPEPAEPPPDIAKNALVDMTIIIDRNTWVKHDYATVELEGGLWVSKPVGATQPIISGSIQTVRGWAVFQSKRFNITRGQIIFTGGKEIVPNLDVVAAYKTGDYVIEAVVGGSANQPSLELRSDPDLEQADILSVLIFGKPTDELNEGQQEALGDRAQEVATSFAATKLAQSVAKHLGVEAMGIQIEELTTERVAVGKYVTEKTYVRVGQDIGGDQGQEVAIEYQIFRNWEFVASTTSAGNNGADVVWHKRY